MICIRNGRIYDPANKENGVIRDLWLNDEGMICEPEEALLQNLPCGAVEGEFLTASPKTGQVKLRVYNADGCALMAGGIDPHSHIAGEPLNLLRDRHSSLVPCNSVLGQEYRAMGYALAANAAMPGLGAARTILEEAGIPDLTVLNLTWIGENPLLLKLAEQKDKTALYEYLAFLLHISCGWGLKLIDPLNGAETWHNLLDTLISANEALGLPHPLHLHHPGLARPDVYEEIGKTAALAAGRRLHLAHLQFYGYKKQDDKITDSAEELCRILNSNRNVTCDVGAVVPGPAAAVTADLSFAGKLGRNKRGFARELWEKDGGFSVLPLRYARENAMGTTQFLTGLSLMLLSEDPEQIFLTTDHPNGGPYTAYPYLMAMLTDECFRHEELKGFHSGAVSRSSLAGIRKEFSLYDIACSTRSGPAKCLGLRNYGHLGFGARGGVTAYRIQSDHRKMFAEPAFVIPSAGEILSLKDRFSSEFQGRSAAPEISELVELYDGRALTKIRPSDRLLEECRVTDREDLI